MIDNLTNWYIRLNRRRLKGEAGPQSLLPGTEVCVLTTLRPPKLFDWSEHAF